MNRSQSLRRACSPCPRAPSQSPSRWPSRPRLGRVGDRRARAARPTLSRSAAQAAVPGQRAGHVQRAGQRAAAQPGPAAGGQHGDVEPVLERRPTRPRRAGPAVPGRRCSSAGTRAGRCRSSARRGRTSRSRRPATAWPRAGSRRCPASRSSIAAVIPASPPPMTTTLRAVHDRAPAAGPLAGLAAEPPGAVPRPRERDRPDQALARRRRAPLRDPGQRPHRDHGLLLAGQRLPLLQRRRRGRQRCGPAAGGRCRPWPRPTPRCAGPAAAAAAARWRTSPGPARPRTGSARSSPRSPAQLARPRSGRAGCSRTAPGPPRAGRPGRCRDPRGCRAGCWSAAAPTPSASASGSARGRVAGCRRRRATAAR